MPSDKRPANAVESNQDCLKAALRLETAAPELRVFSCLKAQNALATEAGP